MTTTHTYTPKVELLSNDMLEYIGSGDPSKLEGIELPDIEFQVGEDNWGGGLRGWTVSVDGDPLGQLWPTEEAAIEGAPESIQFYVSFWLSHYISDRSNKAVTEDGHFSVLPEDNPGPRGHGGREFILRPVNGGDIIITTNLWAQGRVPNYMRDLLPVTHEIVRRDQL